MMSKLNDLDQQHQLNNSVKQPPITTAQFNGADHRHNFSPQPPPLPPLPIKLQSNSHPYVAFNNNQNNLNCSIDSTESNSTNSNSTIFSNTSNQTIAKPKEVSFLEFVEVSADSPPRRRSPCLSINTSTGPNLPNPFANNNQNNDLLQQQFSDLFINEDQCGLSNHESQQFHYEPLQPPAAINTTIHHFHHNHHNSNSTNRNATGQPPLLSLLDPLITNQPPLPNPHPYHYFQPPQSTINHHNPYSTNATTSFQSNSPLFVNGGHQESIQSTNHHHYSLPNPAPLIQYWPTNDTSMLNDDSTNESNNCLISSVNPSNPTPPQPPSLPPGVPPPTSTVYDPSTTICKSSSSDSDTNDSATRLLSNDCCSLSEEVTNAASQLPTSTPSAKESFSNEQQPFALLDNPPLEMKLNPMNLDIDIFSSNVNNRNSTEIPMSDSLWIQMQAHKFAGNSVATEFSSDSNNLNRSGSCKSSSSSCKHFTFHRIGGSGKFGFICPPKPSTIRHLVTGFISILVAIVLFVLLLCYLNNWWLFSGYGSGLGKRLYSLDQDPFWWQSTTFYEIFPASFKDSDGDGYGDFQGITEKIAYLSSLGVSAVRLSSIFAALDYPQRFEHVLNFFTIDPHLGHFSDFVQMIETFHSNHIRVILELNPTITSDQHPWAAQWLLNQSGQSDSGQFRHYYERPKTWAIQNRTEAEILQSNAENLKWSSTDSHDRFTVRSKLLLPSQRSALLDDPFYFGNGLRLNWSHEPVRRQMLNVADHWLQWADGLYLKNLDQIYVENRTERSAIVNDFLHRLRLIVHKREQILQQKLDENSRQFSGLFFGWKLFSSFSDENVNKNSARKILGISNPKWATKKILLCSSRFIEQHLSGIKKRRKVRFKKQQPPTLSVGNIVDNSKPAQFDQLELSDLEESSTTSTGDIYANLHMMPSSQQHVSQTNLFNDNKNNFNNNSLRPYQNRNNNNNNLNRRNQSGSTTSTKMYAYFDLIHFELKLEPNETDTIRDQINHVFLNCPANFPLILWSIGGVHRSRISNRLGSANSVAATFLLTMLPGTVSLFYGDEIGLENSYDQHTRNQYRAGQLCPMAWSSISPNGNFSPAPESTLHPQPHFNIPENSNWSESTSANSPIPIPTTTAETPFTNAPTSSLPLIWLPPNPDYSLINVEKRAQMVKLVSDLNHFRLDHLYLEQQPQQIQPSLLPEIPESLQKPQHQQQSDKPGGSTISSTTSTLMVQFKSTTTKINNNNFHYLFHYIDDSIIVLEQYFDRFDEDLIANSPSINNGPSQSIKSSALPMNSSTISTRPTRRYRYVLFANFGDRPLVKDFSDKFHFSTILLASNANRTSEFLIMKQLKLDPGEAMIASVE